MPGAAERALGVAGVEAAAEVAVLDRGGRDAQVAEELVADPLDRRQRLQPRAHLLRDRVRHVRIDPHGELRRVRRLGELVQRLAHGHGLGIHEVEGVARQVVVRDVRDVVHRARDEVHRHEVRVAALRPGEWEPLGQRVAQLLEQLEEVVGAVDLVHLAGLRVADDDPGPVHEQLRLDALAHQPLRLVLGAVVVVGQGLPLVEHVLLEHALVVARHRDGARVVEAPDVVRVRELDHVLRALDVRALGGLLVGLHVVHGREVEEVVDLLVDALDAEPRLRQVAGDRDDPSLLGTQALDERVELAPRALPHEHVDRAIPLQELGDEMPADEPGRAGDEVVHGCLQDVVAAVYG